MAEIHLRKSKNSGLQRRPGGCVSPTVSLLLDRRTMTTTTTQLRRKGKAKILRKVEHKGLAIGEVSFDVSDENSEVGKEGMLFFNKTKQSWMLDALDIGDEVGIELPLREGRGPDLITWVLPTYAQPEELQILDPGQVSQPSQQNVSGENSFETSGSKRVTGKLRNPRTEKIFEKFMSNRNLTQTEAVEVAITEGLIAMGYEA